MAKTKKVFRSKVVFDIRKKSMLCQDVIILSVLTDKNSITQLLREPSGGLINKNVKKQ